MSKVSVKTRVCFVFDSCRERKPKFLLQTGLNVLQTDSQSPKRMSCGNHTTGFYTFWQVGARGASKRGSNGKIWCVTLACHRAAKESRLFVTVVSKWAPPHPCGLEGVVKGVDALVVEEVNRRRVLAAASRTSAAKDGGRQRKNDGVHKKHRLSNSMINNRRPCGCRKHKENSRGVKN